MSTRINKPLIALVGRPNVGKSTFFNRVTRGRDALVDITPGLTRDRRYAEINYNGLPMVIVDAGGLEELPKLDRNRRTENLSKEDHLNSMVQKQSVSAMEEADLLIVIFDGREGVTPGDHGIMETVRQFQKPVVFAVNKIDDPALKDLVTDFWQLGVEKLLPMGARQGNGVEDVMKEVTSILCKAGFSPDKDKSAKTPDDNFIESPEQDTEEFSMEVDSEFKGPLRIAIAGRPNAGKSSLLNALTNSDRMIVSDIPGTTRDAIDTLLERPDGIDLLFTDTAGIRRKAKVKDRIEKFSALKALDAVRDSHITLIVLDAVEGITDQDKRIIGFAAEHGRASITLFNKWDLIKNDSRLSKLRLNELKLAKKFISYAPHINISALTGKNLEKIFPNIDNVFKDFSKRAGTGQLNRILNHAITRRNPPMSKGHHLKLYYTTQVATCPPSFVIFANYPEYIPEHYRRFLSNIFREALDINLTPVKIFFRQRERRK